MANYKYKLKGGTFEFYGDTMQDVLKSPGMQQELTKYGEAVRDKAGDGYEGELKIYKKRAVYEVRAESPKAKRDNLKHNTLLKALGGGK